jgi:hypothetical protein
MFQLDELLPIILYSLHIPEADERKILIGQRERERERASEMASMQEG